MGLATEERRKPDFERLRAERDAALERVAKEMWAEMGGDPEQAPAFHSRSYRAPCYCACPDGPCEHRFAGWRDILDYEDEPCGSEQFCQRCGEGAMSHGIRTCP